MRSYAFGRYFGRLVECEYINQILRYFKQFYLLTIHELKSSYGTVTKSDSIPQARPETKISMS